MDRAYPVSQIRAAERAVLERSPHPSLMARAAFAIASRATDILGFGYGARVLLLVGGGDNGGDALFAGAELARRGMDVRAVLADPAKTHGAGLLALRRSGGRTIQIDQVGPADLVVDGLLGIGISGPPREAMHPLFDLADATPAPVLAIDLPSGVDADTGAVPGRAVRADRTLCMGAWKVGLLAGDGRPYAGDLELVDLGLGPHLGEPALLAFGGEDVRSLLRVARPGDDKYTRGVVGVAAGSHRYPGAAQLAVGSARLGGVGAVRYAGTARAEVSNRFPDVLVADSVVEAGRSQAWVVGPGLGDGPEAERALADVLGVDVPALVDADGLNLLVERRALLAARGAPTVLTPHEREFERLFGAVGSDRPAAARRAADDSGCVVLLKGFATVVAEPGGRCAINRTGTPALATAGSGDVLSGLIGSLLATGVPPFEAATAGAYLHGEAGRAAAARGPVTALDVIDGLAEVFAWLLAPSGFGRLA